MVARLSQMQDAGEMDEEHASLAMAFCTERMRETVGWARELLGGNGMLLDYSASSPTRRRSTPTKGRARSTRSWWGAP
jgi:alkylation response protein AidB-like acyl-CoA dehydrogenase